MSYHKLSLLMVNYKGSVRVFKITPPLICFECNLMSTNWFRRVGGRQRLIVINWNFLLEKSGEYLL